MRAKEGFALLEEHSIDCVITDYVMPEIDGLGVLKHVKSYKPTCDVVVATAKADIETAVHMMREGAYDYLIKPVRTQQLFPLLESIGEKKSIFRENLVVKEKLLEHPEFNYIISHSRAMDEVLSIASRAASSNATVLIRGESGTGKELIAKAIHAMGNRRDKPFVTVNIAALSETLIESELFGHKKGSFTGAISDRIGRFEEADQGTLFIDEAGDISPNIQIKLLRAIQFGKFEKVGESRSLSTDVRIIAATNQNLEKLIEEGTFRKDLFYRLNVITLWLPPLADRKEDIPPLVHHFIDICKKKNNREILGITEEGMDKLIKYPFPGNVRELENMIERAVVLCRGNYITSRDIFSQQEFTLGSQPFPAKSAKTPDKPAQAGGPEDRTTPGSTSAAEVMAVDYEDRMHNFETRLLLSAISKSRGNKSAAARSLGISERRLRSRLSILGLEQDNPEE